ncbi:MAG: aldo/keto reductase [Patescibacteria group bacterium]
MQKWPRNKFGSTNLVVARICWGCGPLGGVPDLGYVVPEERAIEILLRVFDSPINFLDTANFYGESESRIGKAIKLRGGLSEGFVVATKADRDRQTNSFSASQVRKSVETSCSRLGLKHLPLVYLHDPEYHPLYVSDRKKAMQEILAPNGPVAELEKLRDEGIISYIGISGGPINMLIEFISTGRFDALITHNRWNLLWRGADPLIDKAREMGLGIVNAAAYASGILAAGSVNGARAAYQTPTTEIMKKVKGMESVCQKYNVPLAAAALQFSLRDNRISSTAVGISRVEEVEATLRLAEIALPEKIWSELDMFAIGDEDPEKNRWK